MITTCLFSMGFQFAKRMAGSQTFHFTVPALKIYNLVKYRDWWFFRNIGIEISTACNRKCFYCPNVKYSLGEHFIDEDLFRLILNRIAEINWVGPVNYNHYNETTMNPNLVRYIRMTKEIVKGAMPKVHTNGDFLTMGKMEELLDAGMFNIVISQHDKDPSPEWKERIGEIVARYPKQVTYSITRDLALENWGGLVKIPKGFKKFQRTACETPSASLVIMHTGDVILCCADYFRTKQFGNVKDRSLMEIWNHPEFVAVRKELRQGIARYKMCEKCFANT